MDLRQTQLISMVRSRHAKHDPKLLPIDWGGWWGEGLGDLTTVQTNTRIDSRLGSLLAATQQPTGALWHRPFLVERDLGPQMGYEIS